MSVTLGAIFVHTLAPERLRSVAGAADVAGVDELWMWEDCFRQGGLTSSAAALAWTERIAVGIGIVPLPLRNAAVTAMEVATLARVFGDRFVFGVGHGVQDWMAQVGARPASPRPGRGRAARSPFSTGRGLRPAGPTRTGHGLRPGRDRGRRGHPARSRREGLGLRPGRPGQGGCGRRRRRRRGAAPLARRGRGRGRPPADHRPHRPRVVHALRGRAGPSRAPGLTPRRRGSPPLVTLVTGSLVSRARGHGYVRCGAPSAFAHETAPARLEALP